MEIGIGFEPLKSLISAFKLPPVSLPTPSAESTLLYFKSTLLPALKVIPIGPPST